MTLRHSLLALVAASAMGCSNCGNPSGSDPGSYLRPGTTVLDEGMLSQAGCWEYDPVECTAFQENSIVEVERHGDTLYAVAYDSFNALVLYVSPDLGASWRKVKPAWNPLGWTQQSRLLFFQDTVAMLMWMDWKGDGNITCRQYRLDPQTLAVSEGPNIMSPPVPCPTWFDDVSADGKLSITRDILQSFRPSIYDLVAGTYAEAPMIRCSDPECLPDTGGVMYRVDHVGDVWSNYQRGLGSDGVARNCRFVVNSATGLYSKACSASPLLDNPLYPFVADGVEWVGANSGGRAYLARVHSGAPDDVESFDLGDGEIGYGWGQVVRTNNAKVTGGVRMFSVKNGRPHELGLPATPCVDDACLDVVNGAAGVSGKNAALVYTFGLGNGDYLLFYKLRIVDDQMRTRNELVVTRAHDSNAPASAGNVTDLELQCARESGCFAANGMNGVQACPVRWLLMHGASSDLDRSYQAFMAATDCASLRLADPSGAQWGDSCSGPSCEGDVPVICDQGQTIGHMSCSDWGTHCTLDATLGALCTQPTSCGTSQSASYCDGDLAVTCPYNLQDCGAMGLGCAMQFANPTCVVKGQSCTAAYCDGAVAYGCNQGTATPRLDCGRLGLGCADGDCVVLQDEPACDTTGTWQGRQCDGTKLTWCQFLNTAPPIKRQRTVDCAALGLTCVTDPTFGPQCGSN